MGFTRAELERHRDGTVPDLVGERPSLTFVGINPSLWTAAAGAHFARPGNRFWPALYAAGILDRVVDCSAGMSREAEDHVVARGVAITNLAPRATARADELSTDELRAGRAALERRLAAWRPAVVAIAGITAYRDAFDRRRATAGEQPERLAGARLWVVPNPSGLNAHETVRSLAQAYREAAAAAGLRLDPPRR